MDWLYFNFVLQFVISFILVGEFADKIVFVNVNVINYSICIFASLLLNAILFSIICLFVKGKVQWIVGSILGVVLSLALLAFICFAVMSTIPVDPPIVD